MISRRGEEAGVLHIPAFDEIFETFAPVDTLGWLIFELRYRLSDNVSEQVDQASSWLHFCAVRWEREAMLSNLQQGNSQRPNVRGDGI